MLGMIHSHQIVTLGSGMGYGKQICLRERERERERTRERDLSSWKFEGVLKKNTTSVQLYRNKHDIKVFFKNEINQRDLKEQKSKPKRRLRTILQKVKSVTCLPLRFKKTTMFRNTFHSGLISVFYAVGTHPLQLWLVRAEQDGTVELFHDEQIASRTVELRSKNLSTTSITCPPDKSKSLGIRLPFLVLLLKELGEHFSFEVQVLDDKGNRRRFRASNFQTTTRVNPSITTMPLRLESGWNHVQFDLADFVFRAYGTRYVETLQIEIHANCRLRRVFFADKAYRQEDLPTEFKIFLPFQSKSELPDSSIKEQIIESTR